MTAALTPVTIYNQKLGNNNSQNIGLPLVYVIVVDRFEHHGNGSVTMLSGPKSEDSVRTVAALIDTGAEACHVDTSLARRLNLKITPHKFWISGVTGEKQDQSVFKTNIWFPTAKRGFETEMIQTDFSKTPYKIILGMQFISTVNLLFNSAASQFNIIHR